MHSLENELRGLQGADPLQQAAILQGIRRESAQVFCLYEELRVAIYVAVLLITSGIGLLVKAHLDQIGPLAITVALGAASLLCYASAVRTRLKGRPRSLGGDYVLLLGGLILSADVGYAQAQFHLLGSPATLLLLLALVHGVAAYGLGSRLLLSLSVTALAGYLGVEARFGLLFDTAHGPLLLGLRAVGCAALLGGWRLLHRRLRGPAGFEPVLLHFALHLGFWGSLALILDTSSRWLGVLGVAGLAAGALRQGLARRQESLVLYGLGYGALGACVLEAVILPDPLSMSCLMLVTVVGAGAGLWQLHAGLQEAA